MLGCSLIVWGKLEEKDAGPPVGGHKHPILFHVLPGDPDATDTYILSGSDSGLFGKVVSTDPRTGSILMEVTHSTEFPDPLELEDRALHFHNDLHRTAYTIKAATVEGNQVHLETEVNPLVGRLKVGSIDERTIHSKTPFEFGPTYKGCYLTDAEFSYHLLIAKGDGHSVQLVDPIPENLNIQPDQDLWVVDIAPGDQVWTPAASWSRSEESWGTSEKGVE
jgi:hypothetical protein